MHIIQYMFTTKSKNDVRNLVMASNRGLFLHFHSKPSIILMVFYRNMAVYALTA